MLPLDHFTVPYVVVSMPKPMSESHEPQSFSLFPVIPIRNFGLLLEKFTLKPSLLQCGCNLVPFMSDSHSPLPAFVSWEFSPVITLYSEVAV